MRILLGTATILALLVRTPAIAQLPMTAPGGAPAKDSIYVHMVNVPLALLKGPVSAQVQQCRVNDPAPIPGDTATKNRGDTLIVRVTDGDTAAALPEDTPLQVQLGTNPAKPFVSGMSSVRFNGKAREFAGQQVVVSVFGTGRMVCTARLARPARGTSERGEGPSNAGKPKEFEVPRPDEAVVSIGTSFDFLDGIRAADLYSDLRVFTPALWRPSFLGTRGLGVQAGIYQGRISSPAASTPDSLTTFAYITPQTPIDTAGGLLVRDRRYQRRTSTRQNNLGLYVGVNAELAPNLYWVIAQMEIRKEDVRFAIKDTAVTDTTYRLPRNAPIRVTQTPVSRVFGETHYTPSFTSGLRLDMHRPGYNIMVQPLIGATLRECSTELLPTRVVGTRTACSTGLRFFNYEVSYEVEAAKSGIKLGGEVRGFAARNPDILVFLAKEFTIEKLAELITAKK